MSRWITANEAATLAHCTPSHIFNLIRRGAIRARRRAVVIDGHQQTLVSREDVLRHKQRVQRQRPSKQHRPVHINVGDTVAIDRRHKRNNRGNNPPDVGTVIALHDCFAVVRMPAGYVESFHYDQLEVVRAGGSDKNATAATVAQ